MDGSTVGMRHTIRIYALCIVCSSNHAASYALCSSWGIVALLLSIQFLF